MGHTLNSEVYDRLWCVHEVAEAIHAKIKITGLFDPHSWTLSTFDKLMKIETKNAKCSRRSDKKMLRKKIEDGYGFARLDKKTFIGASRRSIFVLRASKLLLDKK